MAKIRLTLWILVGLALLGVAALQIMRPGKPESLNLTNANENNQRYSAPFELTAHTGQRFSSDSLDGRFRLMYFGYSFCPDVCPIDLAKITAALKTLESDGIDTDLIQPIFVSIDPERDTPEAMADYVNLFHPRLLGLTGSLEEVDALAKRFGVYYKKIPQSDGSDYLMDHLVVIFLMDQKGNYVRLFTNRDSADSIASALKPLLTTGR